MQKSKLISTCLFEIYEIFQSILEIIPNSAQPTAQNKLKREASRTFGSVQHNSGNFCGIRTGFLHKTIGLYTENHVSFKGLPTIT